MYPLGHENVTNFIIKMINNNMLHSSLIFSGIKGIGKATYAKRFATYLISHQISKITNVDVNLFNNTSSRIENLIRSNSCLNYFYICPSGTTINEIINVEQVREIKEKLILTNDANYYNVVIIDSVDCLNINAANALLKVIEETPTNTIFILICHNYNRILPTIRSRCINVNFNPLSNQILKELIINNNIKLVVSAEEAIDFACGSYGNLLLLQNDDTVNFFQYLKNNMTSNIIDLSIYTKIIKELPWDVIINYIKKQFLHFNINPIRKQDIIMKINDYSANCTLLNLEKSQTLFTILKTIQKA